MFNDNSFELGQDLVDYINDSPTMYNAVENVRVWLDEYNFERLDLAEEWKLVKGGQVLPGGQFFVNICLYSCR